MGRKPNILGRAYVSLVSGLNVIGSIWIFALMALINADVFSRYFFNSPLRGIPTIVAMSIIAIVFFQLPDALRNGRVTRNDIVIGKLLSSKSGSGHSWQATYYLLGAVMMALIFCFTLPFLETAWRLNSFVGTKGDFTFPDWPILAVVVFCAFFCCIEFLLQVVRDISAHFSILGRSTPSIIRAITPIILASAIGILLVTAPLSNLEIAVISLILVVVFVYIGVHIGVSLAAISFFAIWGIRDDVFIAGKMLSLAASESLKRFEFGIIPLFVLMGTLISVSDVGADLYKVANQLFRRLKGGLGMATVFANAVFAAVTGTSIASASVFTKVAVPEMIRFGYLPRFAVGVVAGSSVLGMLIPPSMLMILFGILSESSIGDLFIAGIVPGILLSIAYSFMIYLMAVRFPRAIQTKDHKIPDDPLMPMVELMRKMAPIVALITIILGGIYGGFFTATEAGGIGAFGALLLALIRRSLTWPKFLYILKESGQVTAAICFLFISAHVYAIMITVTGLPNSLEDLIIQSGVGFMGLLIIYLAIIILLGTILDAGSIMLIMVPIVIPLFLAMESSGVDIVSLTWIGLLTIIGVEIGLLTPPLGLACFVIHNNLQDSRISVGDVFRGAAPFALVMLLVLILIVIFPEIAMVLL